MAPLEPSMLLEVSSETGTSRRPIRSSTIRIGRATDNDVVLDNEQTVSRHHAELLSPVAGDAEWRIRDVSSHNGTHVNGDRLADDATVIVTPSDVIGIGTVTIRLVEVAVVDGLTIEDPRGAEMHRLLTALSDREREVLTMVANGHTDDQCAKALFISVKTVHSHLDRIRSKTGVRRRAELTRLAVRLGLSSSS